MSSDDALLRAAFFAGARAYMFHPGTASREHQEEALEAAYTTWCETPGKRLVREAALAIELVGEDELEASAFCRHGVRLEAELKCSACRALTDLRDALSSFLERTEPRGEG